MPSADGPEADAFRRIGERPRYDGGFFRVVTGTFVGPDGFTFEREVIRHPGAVCAVPLEADRQSVLMIRQYRAAVDQAMLELPAGKRDIEGEDPKVCIARELVEEIGREATQLTEVARFYNSPGFCNEAHGIEEEHLTVERVALDDVEELMAAGDLADAKSIIGLLAARAVVAGARAKSSQPSIFGA